MFSFFSVHMWAHTKCTNSFNTYAPVSLEIPVSVITGTIPVSKNGTKLVKPIGNPLGNMDSLSDLIEDDEC